MSQFYASIRGNRGEATRMGSRASGISGHIRGWDVGVRVSGWDRFGDDVFDIYTTGGSNGDLSAYVGTVTLVDGVPTFEPADEYTTQRNAGLTEGIGD